MAHNIDEVNPPAEATPATWNLERHQQQVRLSISHKWELLEQGYSDMGSVVPDNWFGLKRRLERAQRNKDEPERIAALREIVTHLKNAVERATAVRQHLMSLEVFLWISIRDFEPNFSVALCQFSDIARVGVLWANPATGVWDLSDEALVNPPYPIDSVITMMDKIANMFASAKTGAREEFAKLLPRSIVLPGDKCQGCNNSECITNQRYRYPMSAPATTVPTSTRPPVFEEVD